MKKKLDLHLLRSLFLTFFKIGLFTFGGGYAMIAVIEDECIEKKRWISHDEMLDIIAVAESTPGPIAVNSATYVGYTQGGFLGAVVSSLGIVCPSFIIIYAISVFLNRFLEIELIANAFMGIRVAVGIVIINAGIKLFKKFKRKDIFTYSVMAVAGIALFLIDIFAINFSTIYLILIFGFVGYLSYVIKKARDGKEGKK